MSNLMTKEDLIEKVARKIYEQFNDEEDDAYAWIEYKRILSHDNIANEYLQIAKEIVNEIVEEYQKGVRVDE